MIGPHPQRAAAEAGCLLRHRGIGSALHCPMLRLHGLGTTQTRRRGQWCSVSPHRRQSQARLDASIQQSFLQCLSSRWSRDRADPQVWSGYALRGRVDEE